MRILIVGVVLALTLPAWAQSLLSDCERSFEDPAGGGDPGVGNWNGITVDYDQWMLPPKLGDHYGGFGGGGGGSQTWTASLTGMVFHASSVAMLSGYVAGGTPNGSIWIQFIDGTSSDDRVVDEFRIEGMNGSFGWTGFVLQGHIMTGHITIVAGVHGGGWGSHACHLDDLYLLIPEPASASLALFGLVGLPFLRRRR